MASLEGILASIPGYGGYLAKRQMNEQGEMQDLQRVAAVEGVLAGLAKRQQEEQARQRQAQFQAAIAADPTRARELAMQFATPKDVLAMRQPTDNRPEILRLTETLSTMQPNDPNRANVEGRIKFLNQGRPQADNRPELLRLQDAAQSLPEGDPRRANIEKRINFLTTRPDPQGSELVQLTERMNALPENDPRRQIFQKRIDTLTTKTPLVSVDNRAESSYAQTVGKGAAERDEAQVTAAMAAPENVAKVDSLIQHLNQSDALTGLGAEIIKNVERVRTLVTQNEKAGKRVSDTELLDAMLGSDVFPMIGALGIGARGLDTPAEREFLRKVMTGTITMNKDTLLRMAKIRRDVADRLVKRYNQRVEGGELDRYFQFSGMPKRKVELPPMPTTAVSKPASGAKTPQQIMEEADAVLRGGQ